MREREGDRQREGKKCCLCSFLSRGYVEREREREGERERESGECRKRERYNGKE